MARWNESSVNTVRINTMNHQGAVRVLTANMRCGAAGHFVDNCAQGGYCANIDPATGRIITPATSKGLETYTAHPDSGIPFEGEVIPQWDELLQAATDMALRLPRDMRPFQRHARGAARRPHGMVHAVDGMTAALVAARAEDVAELIADQRNLGRGLRREFEAMIKGKDIMCP